MKSRTRILTLLTLLIVFAVYLSSTEPVAPEPDFVKHIELNPSPWSYHNTDTDCSPEMIKEAEFLAFTWNKIGFWDSLTESDIKTIREDIEQYLDKIRWKSPPVSGRGIIFSAWPGALRMVFVSIKMLRHYGCTLPVEIWHNNELSLLEKMLMESMDGVSVKNIKDFGYDYLHVPVGSRMYSMKGLALLLTTFDEVLLIDVDNVPAQDPTRLFETDAFKETGALFWKDYWVTRCDNPIYKILQLDCLCEQEQESAQLLVKKSRFGVHTALSLAFYMQKNADLYYKFVHGDKDTFRLSWRYLGLPYHMVRPYPGIAGPKSTSDEICGNTIAQPFPNWVSSTYGPPPPNHTESSLEVMFYHMNAQKDVKYPNIPFTARFDNPISPMGNAIFFNDEHSFCVALVSNTRFFRANKEVVETDKRFLELYSGFYGMFEFPPDPNDPE